MPSPVLVRQRRRSVVIFDTWPLGRRLRSLSRSPKLDLPPWYVILAIIVKLILTLNFAGLQAQPSRFSIIIPVPNTFLSMLYTIRFRGCSVGTIKPTSRLWFPIAPFNYPSYMALCLTHIQDAIREMLRPGSRFDGQARQFRQHSVRPVDGENPR